MKVSLAISLCCVVAATALTLVVHASDDAECAKHSGCLSCTGTVPYGKCVWCRTHSKCMSSKADLLKTCGSNGYKGDPDRDWNEGQMDCPVTCPSYKDCKTCNMRQGWIKDVGDFQGCVWCTGTGILGATTHNGSASSGGPSCSWAHNASKQPIGAMCSQGSDLCNGPSCSGSTIEKCLSVNFPGNTTESATSYCAWCKPKSECGTGTGDCGTGNPWTYKVPKTISTTDWLVYAGIGGGILLLCCCAAACGNRRSGNGGGVGGGNGVIHPFPNDRTPLNNSDHGQAARDNAARQQQIADDLRRSAALADQNFRNQQEAQRAEQQRQAACAAQKNTGPKCF